MSMNITASVSDLDNSLDAIKELKMLDLVKTEYHDVRQFIEHRVRHTFASSIYLPKGFAVYRARVNLPGVLFHNETDISYRPDLENIKDFGRTNKPGQPIFYASTDPDTALYEVSRIRKEEDQDIGKHHITVGLWVLTKRLHLLQFVHHSEASQRNPEVRDQYQHQDSIFRSLESDVYERVDRILRYFSDEFAKPATIHHEYKISCAIYDLDIEMGNLPRAKRDLGFSGALYPSVRNNLRGLNISLEPNAVDDALELNKVLVQRVRKDETFVSILPEKVAHHVRPDGSFDFETVKDPVEIHITV